MEDKLFYWADLNYNFFNVGDISRQRQIDYYRERVVDEESREFFAECIYNQTKVLDFEHNYLVESMLTASWGNESDDRTGTGTFRRQSVNITLPVFYQFPIMRGKQMGFKTAQTEWIWMLMGRTDLKFLNDRGVKYWNEFAFRDENGLPKDDLGPIYGKQLRYFGDGYENTKDQLLYVINELRTNPDSRRAMFSLWNPIELEKGALPCCHVLYHFTSFEHKGERFLDLHVTQRSADLFLGVPYDFCLFAFFLHFMSIFTGMKPRYVHCTFNDFHLYRNHLGQIRQHSDNYNTILFKNWNGIKLVDIAAPHLLPQITYEKPYIRSFNFTRDVFKTKLTKQDLDLFFFELDSINYELFKLENYDKDKRFGKIEAKLSV